MYFNPVVTDIKISAIMKSVKQYEKERASDALAKIRCSLSTAELVSDLKTENPLGVENFEATLKNLRYQFQSRSLLWILQRSLQRNITQFEFTSLRCWGGGGALPKTVLVRTFMPQSHARIPLLTLSIAMIGAQRTARVYCYWNTFNCLIWLCSIRNALFNTINDFNCGIDEVMAREMNW